MEQDNNSQNNPSTEPANTEIDANRDPLEQMASTSSAGEPGDGGDRSRYVIIAVILIVIVAVGLYVWALFGTDDDAVDNGGEDEDTAQEMEEMENELQSQNLDSVDDDLQEIDEAFADDSAE